MKEKLNKSVLLNKTVEINKTAANVFEHFDLTDDDIISIINNKKPSTMNQRTFNTMVRFNEGFNYILFSNDCFDFNKLKLLHEVISYGEALNPGKIRIDDNFVYGKNNTSILIPHHNEIILERKFNTLLHTIKKENISVNKKIKLIIEFMIEQITDQWFNDCNKRISLLTANKLLIEISPDKELFSLSEFNSEEFNELLADYYESKYITNKEIVKNKEKLVNFLINSISSFSREELKSKYAKILKTEYSSITNLTHITSSKLKKSILEEKKNQFDKVVSYYLKGNKKEVFIANDLDSFLESIDKHEYGNVIFIEEESDKDLLKIIKSELSKH